MKRLLCAVLSAVLVVSLVPSPALAELADELEVIAQGEVVPPADAQVEPSLDDVTDDQVNAQAPEGASEEKPSQDPLPQEESQLDDAVEVQSSEDGDAVLTQSVTEPTNIWLEQYADYYDEPSWTSNTYILEQSVTFRIRASNMENGDEFSADAYLWQNAAPTITFVSTTDPTVTYDVPLREGGTYIDGLFSQMDGSYVPLPAGSYTVIFTGEGGQQYSTSAYDNGTYTMDAGIVFRNYYGANAAGQLTRDALVVKPAGGTESLETLPLGGKLDLSLSVRALSAIDELGAPSSCYLYMYGAQDAQGNALTLDQLEAQYASGQTDDWPNPLYWNDTHTNERIVWERVNATTGSNGTRWSLGSSEAGSKEGSFAIRNIDLSIKDGTNPSIEPGVYFPVLKVKMGDQTYRFAYNPVEVVTANTEQVAPTIVTQSLPSAMRGTAYATTLVARSGAPVGTNPGSMTWSITAGTLPQGLSLNATTGAISGTPAQGASTQTVTITLTETINGNAMTSSKQYTIEVRDAVTLGTISYSKETIFIEDQNGATLHLSVPVSADLTRQELNLAQSDVVYNVYQTARGSTSSMHIGAFKAFDEVYDSAKKTLEIDADISYDTTSIDRIEVILRLCDNAGNPVLMPREGNNNGEGDWAIITSTVENPGILMGSYVEFPQVDLPEVLDARVRLWPYVAGTTFVPQDTKQYDLDEYYGGAVYDLEPGTYAFAIEGEVPIYDENGVETDDTRWVNIVKSGEGYTAIPGTYPQQYKLVVGGNEGTHHMPKRLGVVYTTANISQRITYRLNVQFAVLAGETEPRSPWYSTCWYRLVNGEYILVGSGNSVDLGPSTYPLYVQVTPTGRDTAFWNKTEYIEVGANETQKSITVPRKDQFKGTFTLSCPEGRTPKDGQTWGVIEVQTPLASGGTSSRNFWPTKRADDECKVEITGLTSGSIITWTPRVELKAGTVTYTVGENVTGNFSDTLQAPDPCGLITLEGLAVEGEGQTYMNLTDGSTAVLVERVQGQGSTDVRVPYYVADGSSIILQPEQGYEENYFEVNGTTTYKLTVTKHDKTAPDRMGTAHADYAAKKTYTVTLSKTKTTATVQPDDVTSYGYVNVPFKNDDKLLCTLLLFDKDGKMVENGPAGKNEQLRTPYLPAGAYTLYAVDANYLPQIQKNAGEDLVYVTKAEFVSALATNGNSDRATSTTLQVTGQVTTAGVFAFPKKSTTAVVNQSKSWVTMESVYTDHLAVNMHAVLTKSIDLADAHLEIQTNQPSIDMGASVGMNPQALTVNGKAVNLSQWSEGWGPVLGRSSKMNDGALDINLSALKDEIGQKYVTFPMDMTLIIPQTVNGYTEASIWLVKGTGSNRVRSLVGTYYGNTEEVTLTTPEVVAWDTFGVYGDTAPHALVTIYVEGMRAATTEADTYGYYEAQVTLPEQKKSGQQYNLVASAQWTKKGAAYAAVSETADTLYSTTFPAVERITLCYQEKADAEYKAMRLYYRGAELNKYFTIQRDGHTADNQADEEASKFFYLVEYANGEYIDTVNVGIPDLDTYPVSTTDNLNTAKQWIADVQNAQSESEEEYQRFAQYGWTMVNAGSAVKGALTRNTTSNLATRAFVSEPISFADYTEEMELEFTLREFEEPPLINELPAADLGRFDGWKTETVAQNTPISASQLTTYLNGMSAYDGTRGRLFVLSNDQKTDMDDETNLNTLLADDTLTSGLIESGGDVHEWLLVGGTSMDETEEKALLLEHSVETQDMSHEELQADLNVVLNDAKKVSDAYEKWCKDGTKPTDQSVGMYQGAANDAARVMCAGGVASTRNKGMPYFIETMDGYRDARAEWMLKYEIEGYYNTYLYCRLYVSKETMSTTWWNEAHNQKATITYTLPDKVKSAQELRYADLLEQWYQIKAAIFANLDAGNQALENTDPGVSTQSSGSESGAKNSPRQPKQQSKLQELLTTIGDWKLWWDGNDTTDGAISTNIDTARENDVSNAGTPNSDFWNSPAAQGGTLGEASSLGVKASAAGYVMERGGVKLAEDALGSQYSPAGRLFWAMDHKKWAEEKMREFSGKEEDDFQEWNKLRWQLEERPYLTTEAGVDRYFYLLHKYGDDKTDDWFRRHAMQVYQKQHKKKKTPKKKADPSGVVYEAVLSNPVEGAKVTLYAYNKSAASAGVDPAQFINSLKFGIEDNPQVTGANGRYKWDVPEGFWQIRVSKEGYEDASTGSNTYGLDATTDIDGDGVDDGYGYWMPVLPIQLDVNIPLVSYEAPVVQKVEADEAGATITFSKYMQVSTVTADRFKVAGKTPASVKATDAEAAGNGSGIMLARTFRIAYAGTSYMLASKKVEVALADTDGKIKSYAGVSLAQKARTEAKTVTVQDKGNVKHITVPKATNRTYNGKAQTGVAKGTGYTLSGTTSATNAGTYKATAKLAAGCMWADGTTASKTLKWNIARAKVNKPAAGAKLTYTGKTLTGVAAGTGYTRSGTYEAKAANKYTAYATPDANHCWPDGSVARITLSWQITSAKNTAKAKKTSVKKTFKRATVKKKAQTFSLPKVTTKFGAAKWKVSAKDKKKVLSLSKDKKKIQVKKGAKKGTYTIKLKASVAKTSNYGAATTKAVTVKVTIK